MADSGGAEAWAHGIVSGVERALSPLGDAERAQAMQTYLKGIAPFLGIQAPDRRHAVRPILESLGPPPDERGLAAAARALFARPEREYAYVACDLIARWVSHCTSEFLVHPVEELLTTRPWWDTVDALGSAAVSPLCRGYPELSGVILRWSASGDVWLVRSALQHQRGWHEDTDVPFVLTLCGAHADNSEFFIQKAIGWALRDLARLDAASVATFLDQHPVLTRTATREAERGLGRRA